MITFYVALLALLNAARCFARVGCVIFVRIDRSACTSFTLDLADSRSKECLPCVLLLHSSRNLLNRAFVIHSATNECLSSCALDRQPLRLAFAIRACPDTLFHECLPSDLVPTCTPSSVCSSNLFRHPLRRVFAIRVSTALSVCYGFDASGYVFSVLFVLVCLSLGLLFLCSRLLSV